ncbi:MAG: DNA gyrase C-terminal beta-propeller domain-containing protein [Chloroflexota bacterium]
MQERPDLTGIPAPIVDYIEYLENQIALLQASNGKPKRQSVAQDELPREPSEPPTTINLITYSQNGIIKRTPRHHYYRQNRGGMGIFDLEMDESDQPKQILFGDESGDIFVLTNFARIYRLPVSKLPEVEVRARGTVLRDYLSLHEKEQVVSLLGQGDGDSVAILTTAGYVLTRNRNYLKNGAILYDIGSVGRPHSISWAQQGHDVFVATQGGVGIRFSMKQVHQNGSLAMRLESNDTLLGITTVSPEGQVLLATADGKGTLRMMAGFRPNKSPGAGGKVAIKSSQVIGVTTTSTDADLFLISKLGKLIRFAAADIPPKTGVVQGVNLISLRSDEACAVTTSKL